MKLILLGLLCLSFACFSQDKIAQSKAYLNNATSADERGDYVIEISEYTKFLTLNPNDKWGYMVRGEAEAKLNNITQALNDINISLSLDSNYAMAYYQRAYIKRKLGDEKGAEWDINKADDILHPFFIKAKLEQLEGDYKDAAIDYKISLKFHPYDIDTYFEIAWVEKNLEDDYDADFYFRKGLILSGLAKYLK